MDRSPSKHPKSLVWKGSRDIRQDAGRGLLPQAAAERFLIDRCRVFRLAQHDLHGGEGTVEWSIISRPLPKGEFQCSAIRAEAEGPVCGSQAARKRRSSVVVHTWQFPLENAFVKSLATRLRTIRVPLEPGMSSAAMAFFTLCELDVGLLDSAVVDRTDSVDQPASRFVGGPDHVFSSDLDQAGVNVGWPSAAAVAARSSAWRRSRCACLSRLSAAASAVQAVVQLAHAVRPVSTTRSSPIDGALRTATTIASPRSTDHLAPAAGARVRAVIPFPFPSIRFATRASHRRS